MKAISDVKMKQIIQRILKLFTFGKWPDLSTGALFAVGNGTDDENRRNAFEVKDNAIVVNGQEMTAENVASLLDHFPNTENPHGVTTEQLGIPGLRTHYLSIGSGKSVKFRIDSVVFVFGRYNAAAATACAAYVVAGYSHSRAPLVTQISAGSYIALSTGGDNDNGWYVEISNTNTGGTDVGIYIMGRGTPLLI